MAIIGAKVAVTHTISWTPGSGDSLKFSGSESFTQVGLLAGMQTVNAATTTTALPIFGASGAKYFGVKNTDPGATVYVDIVTPVVPSAAAHVLPPGKTMMVYTQTDAWYAIASSGTPEIVVSAVQP
jgi:hypothetical protein